MMNGNLTQGYTPEGYVFTAAYDAENRLKTIEYVGAGSVTFKTEYLYRWKGILAIEKKYENSNPVEETRFGKQVGKQVGDVHL